MESLLSYGSDTDTSSERDVSEFSPAAKRSKRLNASGSLPAVAVDSQPISFQKQQQKYTSLLPSAAELLDGSYSPPPAAQQRQLEQAVLHQGRSRAFPHVPGSFATHVYIEVLTPPGCLAALTTLLQALSSHLPSLQPVVHSPSGSSSDGSSRGGCRPHAAAPLDAAAPAVPLEAQAVYHVSLSRTVPLLLHQIEPLVQLLRRRLRQQDTFCIRMGRPEVLVNDKGSRTFLALAAGGSSQGGAAAVDGVCVVHTSTLVALGSGGGAQQEQQAQQTPQQAQQEQHRAQQAQQQAQHYSPRLVALCHVISSVFASHGLPRFYADPRPHASVAWLLGNEQQHLEAALAQPEVQAAAAQLEAQVWQLVPAAIVCKSGQRVHTVWEAAGSGGNASC